jgi:hypothetical protein
MSILALRSCGTGGDEGVPGTLLVLLNPWEKKSKMALERASGKGMRGRG